MVADRVSLSVGSGVLIGRGTFIFMKVSDGLETLEQIGQLGLFGHSFKDFCHCVRTYSFEKSVAFIHGSCRCRAFRMFLLKVSRERIMMQ
jgi:hypothetical protein